MLLHLVIFISISLSSTVLGCSGNCKDELTNCHDYLAQCQDPLYFPLMYERCKCTCNLCNLCQDVRRECPCWKENGFCENPFYQNQRHLCDMSCGYCTATPSPESGATSTRTVQPDSSGSTSEATSPTTTETTTVTTTEITTKKQKFNDINLLTDTNNCSLPTIKIHLE